MILYLLVGGFAALIATMIWVRIAPIDPHTWHRVDLPVGKAGEFSAAGSYTVLIDVSDGAASLRALDGIISQTPRTKRVAGQVEDGRLTYVTRSAFFGFPDYTTVAVGPQNASLAVFGRLRFGRSDLGVNRARITGWLAALDRGTPAP